MLQSSAAFSGFSVDDVDAARSFYADVLGVTVRTDAMGMLRLVLGDGREVLVYPSDAHAPGSATLLNFPVDDVAATVAALTERGVAFLRYDGFPQDEQGIMTGGGPLIAWFTDPAGNVLSVIDANG